MDGTGNNTDADRRPPRGGDRRHQFPRRTRQVFVRLSDDEHHDLTAAAARADLTPTGYVAEAALAAARNTTPPDSPGDTPGLSRPELAQLQRELVAARTAVTTAATHLHHALTAAHTSGTTPPVWLQHAVTRCRHTLDTLDTLAAALHRRLS